MKVQGQIEFKDKKELAKQIEYRLVEVTQYPTLLDHVVSVAKKVEKIRICVNYKDLKKTSSKDNFLLPNIHIPIDN